MTRTAPAPKHTTGPPYTQEEMKMYSTEWIANNDLSLAFDGTGRLWKFRSNAAYGRPVSATLQDTDLVITVEAPGVRPGDLDVALDGSVLEIVGTGAAKGAPTRVGLPKRVELHTLATSYDDGRFEIRVPLVPATTVATPELETVPVAC
jgi:HSP20 family molecular chaperone IbpA